MAIAETAPPSRPVRPLPMFPARMAEPGAEVVRHAQAGPRYTSYPPATEFRDRFGAADAARDLAALAQEPIGVYLHVPFCSQLCWYCGCNVIATRDRSRGSAYVELLIRELALVTAAMGRRPRVTELALGGGSPNFLSAHDLTRLVAAIDDRCAIEPDAEIGLELDPRDTTVAQIDELGAFGFTRLSVGVQDFSPEVQVAIHRIQSVEQTRAVVVRARARGFRSVNVDLIYGLPGQTVAGIEHTVAEVVALAPDRIAVFGYAHLPHLRPHQHLVTRSYPVPDLAARVELLRAVLDRLADAGYVRVGLDHFARPDDPLVAAAGDGRLGRNFQGYVVRRASALVGCGVSAISDSGNAYWQNHVELDAWTRAVEAGQLPVARGVRLDDDDRLRRDVIMQLMCTGGVDLEEVASRHGVEAGVTFAAELDQLEASHRDLALVDRATSTVTATPLGHHLIRNVARVFDRYARGVSGGSPTI